MLKELLKLSNGKELDIEYPIELKDSKGNEIYFEDSDGYWNKREYDSNSNVTYFEDSDGFWIKREFDSKGNEIYFETSNGYWIKREFDSKGNEIYFETSKGVIRGTERAETVELTVADIEKLLGKSIKIVKG